MSSTAYRLSATKLQTYQRCPQAYAFQYEHGLKQNTMFGSAALGQALHQALAVIYQDWHYQTPKPAIDWLQHCWQTCTAGLSEAQILEGQKILEQYYDTFIAPEDCRFLRPVAVEGRIQGELLQHDILFSLTGRYDRLDRWEDGLELIDYKSGKQSKALDTLGIDLQLGVYYLALEQHYGQALKRMSLLYLRTGEKVSLDVTADHKERVTVLIGNLAHQLRTDDCWEPHTGDHCDRCSFARYCSAMQEQPEPLPLDRKPLRQIQLALAL